MPALRASWSRGCGQRHEAVDFRYGFIPPAQLLMQCNELVIIPFAYNTHRTSQRHREQSFISTVPKELSIANGLSDKTSPNPFTIALTTSSGRFSNVANGIVTSVNSISESMISNILRSITILKSMSASSLVKFPIHSKEHSPRYVSH